MSNSKENEKEKEKEKEKHIVIHIKLKQIQTNLFSKNHCVHMCIDYKRLTSVFTKKYIGLLTTENML